MLEKLQERARTMSTPIIEDKPSPHDGYVKEIQGLLREKNIRRIGLLGKEGTGKTTIMKILNNNNDIAKIFDIVIWVTVSKDWSVGKLQRAITDQLKLNVEGMTDLDEIASQISLKLECKRYLILLDDVCEPINLDTIAKSNSQKDGKVVMASRYRNVYCQMDVDELINVKSMPPKEAWTMFMEIVGPKVNLPRIKPIAEKIVRECSGLPLSIINAADTLRKKDSIDELNESNESINEFVEVLNSLREQSDIIRDN